MVRPDAVPPAVATLGARVVFAVEGRGGPESRVLVMPEEHAEGGGRTVAVSTPLGAALLGLAAGQSAEVLERDGRRLALRLLAVDRETGLDGTAPPVWPPPRLAQAKPASAAPRGGDRDPPPPPPSQPPPLPPMPPSAA